MVEGPVAGLHYPTATGEFMAWFSTDADCLDYLEWLRWPSGDASGYHGPGFGGVDVPPVSGLVGMRPRASYIMMPIPPGCPIDVQRAAAGTGTGAGDPPDGTSPDDGWALFSGTSAAAPQIAGAAAVLRGVRN